MSRLQKQPVQPDFRLGKPSRSDRENHAPAEWSGRASTSGAELEWLSALSAPNSQGVRRRIGNTLHRRIVRPLVKLLTQGIAPERISFCIALGFAISIFPILGVATLLCTLAAALFRLNLPLIQGVNYAATPAQLSLILPYIRLGERLFGGEGMTFSLAELFQRFEADWAGFFADFWVAGLKALGAWLLTAPLIVGVVYLTLVPLLHRLSRGVQPEPQ